MHREVRDAGPQTNREARMAAAGGPDRGRGDAAKPNRRCAASIICPGQHWHCSMCMQAILMIATAKYEAVLSVQAAQNLGVPCMAA